MKTAALYARVSTTAQGEEEKASIPEQRRRIEEYCQTKGYAVVDQYVDVGYSGAKKNRPAFQRMLKDAKDRKFEVVVCWKADRLSRGMYPAAALMEVVEPLGIGLEAVEEHLDMNYFAMLAVVGKIEVDNIRARTKFGREDRAKNKHLHPGGHYINYGLTIKDGAIAIVEPEAVWIRDLFLWVADGKSARSWCQYANSNGFLSRNATQGVTAQQVSMWLRNPAYKGEYHWNKSSKRSGKRVKLPESDQVIIACPAIVSPELWERVQERLKLNRRYSVGNAKHSFLLRGLLKCAECGKSFVGGATGGTRYYECYGTRNYPHRYHCRQPHRVKADLLEQACWGEIIDKVTDLVSEDDAVLHLIDTFEANKAKLDAQLAKEREGLEDCMWQRQRIATRERQGYLSFKEAELQYRAIRSEEERHQAEITKLEQLKSDSGDLDQVKELVRRADWLVKNFRFGNFRNAPGDKRRFLENLVDTITVPGSNSTNQEVEVRLKVPSPDAAEAVASLSMHNTA